MGAVYLCRAIVESRLDDMDPRRYLARDGYTRRSGAPTRLMVRLAGETRWRRVWVRRFSNAGTTFVRIGKVPHICYL